MRPRTTLLVSALLLIALLAAGWVVLRQPRPIPLTPNLTGKVEYCLTCHNDLPEISPSHPVQTFGCVICHGGERLALDADLAHSSMRGGRNPSDFAVVEASCGGSDCHSGAKTDQRDHIQRVLRNVQGTYAGAITMIRFTFGAQPDLIARYGIYAVRNPDYLPGDPGVPFLEAFDPSKETNLSILNFASNCLTCHLTAPAVDPKIFSLPASPGSNSTTAAETQAPEFARLTGCAACHTPTSGTNLTQPLHRLTTALSYTQCNTCHNRGNYDLRNMQFILRNDHRTSRQEDYYQPIAQFTRCEWTLDCVDCHTRQEAMGDGAIHSNKKEIQYTRCFSCHGTLTELPKTTTIEDSNDLALRLAFLNPVIDLKVGDTILVTEKGEPLWNTRLLPDGTYELFGKGTGQRFTFRPVLGTGCKQKPKEQESRYCHVCHAVKR
jgi:Cytochrome c554 and c-prime